MEILATIFFLISFSLLFLLSILSYFIIKIITGKSINDPSFVPVKGTIFNQLLYIDHLFDYQAQLVKKHPTYRLLGLSYSEIFTADTRNVEYILKTNYRNYLKGKERQETVGDLWGQGIFAADGPLWRHQRKLAVSEFSTKVLREFSCSVFRKNAVTLIRDVSMLVASGLEIPIEELASKRGFYSLFEVGFGIDLSVLDKLSEEGPIFRKAFDDANYVIFGRFFDPFWKLKRFLNIGSEADLRRKIKVVDDFIYNVISIKKNLLALKGETDEKADLLSRFLLESKKDPEIMTDKYLRDIILNFMIAGLDSTATAMSWFFIMLCKHPLIQEKIAQEVIDITGKLGNKIADDDVEGFMDSITNATLEEMHYLHAALTETLRLYPSVPADNRSAEEDDVLPDGHKVKKGDLVGYVSYAMGRMPYIWGEDAADFRPERWLKDGVFQPESPFKFITFHAGPQMCIGKEFTYRQVKMLIIPLIRYFRFKLGNGMENVTYRTQLILKVNKRLLLCAVPRTNI